jgi:hypothetical protein
MVLEPGTRAIQDLVAQQGQGIQGFKGLLVPGVFKDTGLQGIPNMRRFKDFDTSATIASRIITDTLSGEKPKEKECYNNEQRS